MPTYDYECRSCGHSLEVFQRMSDSPLTQCPGCGREELQRLIGGGLGVIFRGSGFYVNDARGNASSSADGTSTPGQDLKKAKSDSAKKNQASNSSASADKKATA